MGYFNGILKQKDPINNSEEVIQTYANRLQHATLLSDRKSAVKGLKSFSKDHREIVVQYGLRALLAVLEKDVSDSQAVKAVLETLLILFLRGEASSEDLTLGWISNQSRLQNGKYPSPLLVDGIEIDQFSMWIADEILLSDTQVRTFLTILQEHLGFQIRLYSLQLLEAMVATRPVRAKETLINIPLAISTIVELLADPNDPIRNETILLLMALVNNNFNIQKLVAFENTFERVFEIIEEEGGIRGSILVQDCLTLLTNLLMYNASNQKLFLETECVPKLARLIAEPIEEDYEEGLKDENGDPIPLPPIVWTEQRLQNMIVLLEICKSFVDPDNQHVSQNQQKLESSGIFYSVLRLIFSPMMEHPIRRTALQVVGDIMADNPELQLKFSQLDVPYIDPSLPAQVQRYYTAIPAPVALVNWAILTNSVHIFDIRLAAMHCLSCFFKNNSDAKIAFLSDQIKSRSNPSYYHDLQVALNEMKTGDETKNDASEESYNNPPLANIFGTLMDFNTDTKLNPYSSWFAANILVTLIKDCPDARNMAREIKDGDAENGEEVLSLIQAVSGLLTANLDTSDPRIAIGCLMLLSFWLYEDFEAVNDFLTESSVIKSILAFLSKNSSELSEIVHGLATIFVGIVYEFTRADSPITRASLFEIVTKSLGVDNYSSNVKQFKENPAFKNFDGSIETDFERDSTGLPTLYFIPEYVELVKENSYIIKRALFRGPEFEPRVKLSHEKLEELENKNVDYVKEIQELKQEAQNKEAEFKLLVAEYEKEIASTTELFKKCQLELDLSKESETELSDKLEQLAKELAEVQAQKAKFSASSEQYTAKYHELLKSLTKNEESLKKASRSISELEEAKTKAEGGINKMSRELFLLSKSKAESEAKIASFEKEMVKVKAEHEKSVNKYNDQIKQLQRENDELHTKIHLLEEALNFAAPVSDDKLDADKNVNPAKLRELQIQLSEREDENDNLLEKLRAAASVVSDLRLNSSHQKQEIENLQRELAQTYEDLEVYSQLLDEVNEFKMKRGSKELDSLRSTLRRELDNFRKLLSAPKDAGSGFEKDETLEEPVAFEETEITELSELVPDNGVMTVSSKEKENLSKGNGGEDNVIESATNVDDEDKIKGSFNGSQESVDDQDAGANTVAENVTGLEDLETEERSLFEDALELLALAKSQLQAQLLGTEELKLKVSELQKHNDEFVLKVTEEKNSSKDVTPNLINLADKTEELRLAYSRIARLEGNIEALSVSATESLASFKSSRESLQSRVDELESIKSKLLEEIENMKESHKTEISAKEEAFDDLEGAYFDLELLMSNVEKNKEEVDIKFNQMKKEYIVKIGQLQDEVQDLKKSLSDACADRDAINSEFNLLEKLSNRLESELKAKEALLQAIADKGADLAAKDAIVIQIKERLASTIAQLSEAAQKNRALNKEKEEIEKIYNETSQKLKTSLEKIEGLEKDLQVQSDDNIKAENDKRRLISLQVEKAQASEMLESQRVEISNLKAQISSMEQLVKSSLQQLEDERKINSERSVTTTLVHTEQVSKLEESIAKSQKTHESDLRLFEANVESKAQKLNMEILALTEECSLLKQRLASAEASLRDDSELISIQNDAESLISDLNKEISSKSDKITSLEEKMATLRSEEEYNALAEDLKSCASRSNELENSVERLQSQLAEKEERLKLTELKHSKLFEDNETEKKHLNFQISALDTQLLTLNKEMEAKQESIEVTENDEELKKLQAQFKELQAKALQVELEAEESKQCVNRLTASLDEKVLEVNNLKSQIGVLQAQVEQVKSIEVQNERSMEVEASQIEEKESEILKLNDTCEELSGRIEALESELLEAKNEQRASTELQIKAEADKLSSDATNERLKLSLMDAEQKSNDSESRIADLTLELESLRTQQSEKLKNETLEYDQERKTFAKMVEDKDAEIESLKVQLSESNLKLTEFATIPVASTSEVVASLVKPEDLEDVLLLCEEQQKTILRLKRQLEALDLPILENDDLDLH